MFTVSRIWSPENPDFKYLYETNLSETEKPVPCRFVIGKFHCTKIGSLPLSRLKLIYVFCIYVYKTILFVPHRRHCSSIRKTILLMLGGRDSDSLQAGGFGARTPMGARFSAPVQTGPEAHPTSFKRGAGSPYRQYHPPSCQRVKEASRAKVK